MTQDRSMYQAFGQTVSDMGRFRPQQRAGHTSRHHPLARGNRAEVRPGSRAPSHGRIDMALDRVPRVFRLAEGVYAVHGYSGRGVAFACALG